jgi:hypothetical protein
MMFAFATGAGPMQIDHKCVHEACKCLVPEADTYCCDYCRDSHLAEDGAPRTGECRCGHDRCGLSEDAMA